MRLQIFDLASRTYTRERHAYHLLSVERRGASRMGDHVVVDEVAPKRSSTAPIPAVILERRRSRSEGSERESRETTMRVALPSPVGEGGPRSGG